jgi:hypothetical protein
VGGTAIRRFDKESVRIRIRIPSRHICDDKTRRDGMRIQNGGWSARDEMFRKILNPARASSTSLPP